MLTSVLRVVRRAAAIQLEELAVRSGPSTIIRGTDQYGRQRERLTDEVQDCDRELPPIRRGDRLDGVLSRSSPRSAPPPPDSRESGGAGGLDEQFSSFKEDRASSASATSKRIPHRVQAIESLKESSGRSDGLGRRPERGASGEDTPASVSGPSGLREQETPILISPRQDPDHPPSQPPLPPPLPTIHTRPSLEEPTPSSSISAQPPRAPPPEEPRPESTATATTTPLLPRSHTSDPDIYPPPPIASMDTRHGDPKEAGEALLHETVSVPPLPPQITSTSPDIAPDPLTPLDSTSDDEVSFAFLLYRKVSLAVKLSRQANNLESGASPSLQSAFLPNRQTLPLWM